MFLLSFCNSCYYLLLVEVDEGVAKEEADPKTTKEGDAKLEKEVASAIHPTKGQHITKT